VGLFALLKLTPRLDPILMSASFHIVVVSLLAGLALLVGIAAGIVAGRTREAALVLVALGCVCVGVLMLTHGLTTPIGTRAFNMWVARAPVLAIVLFGVCLAGAVAAPNNRAVRLAGRRPRGTLFGVGAALTLLCAVVVADPSLGGAPFPGEVWVTRALAAVGALLLVATAAVYRGKWLLGRDRVQLALALACLLAAEAMLSLQLGVLWRLSWWDYHVLLLTGFGTAAYAVFVSARRERSIEDALRTISLKNALEHITTSYPETLRALVAAVEAKDVYTHGHSTRVAEMSIRIGQQLGVGPDSLRRLAQGALLHDIGKIGVPDHILNKPGSLTEDEWEWIKQHPIIGEEIVSRAPSLRHTLNAIRHHHERVDGGGYPDGITGPEISLEARIVAVADVWDAIRSDRAYRPGWPAQQAVDHMVAGRGSHFDPECLDALLAVLRTEGIAPSGGPGDVHEVEAAAEACHHDELEAAPASDSAPGSRA
jgi:hypothetical protein